MNKIPVKKYIQALIISVFLFLIARYFLTHREDLNLLTKIRPRHAVALFVLLMGILTCHAANVLMLLRKLDLKDVSLYAWTRMFIIARYISFHVTQGRIIYLLYKLKKDYQYPYTHLISTMLFQSWYYTFTTLIFCFIALLFFPANIYISGYNIILWILGLILPFALLPQILSILKNKTLKDGPFNKFFQQIDRFLIDFQKILQDGNLVIKIGVICLFQYMFYLIMIRISFKAIGLDPDISFTVIFSIILIISKFHNIVPGNIGITEMLCGTFTAQMGGKLSDGIIVSSLIRVIDYLLLTFLGILFARSLKPITKEQLQTIKNEDPFFQR